jgi:membrane protein YdbS with pleckstrin-like domain
MRTKLQAGETVALIVRKHWIVLAKPALFFLLVLFSFPFRHVRLAGFEAVLSYLFPYLLAISAGLLLYRYLDRKVNIWTVTTLRLIDEWGIVTHRSKENPLDKINDIVVEQTIAGRIFNYRSISVQTAATAGETVIEFVERPEDLKQTINAQKALRSEREKRPDLPIREAPRRQSAPLPQTVLLHESVNPPLLSALSPLRRRNHHRLRGYGDLPHALRAQRWSERRARFGRTGRTGTIGRLIARYGAHLRHRGNRT